MVIGLVSCSEGCYAAYVILLFSLSTDNYQTLLLPAIFIGL